MRSNSWITSYGDKVPIIHPEALVDVSVRIIGDVHVDKGASIWPMAVLAEEEALISHGAIVHGARIQSRSLVGIGAIILDGALVSTGSIVGAGSLIPPGTEIPPNSLVLGVPGKIIRETTPQERQAIVDQVQELHRKSRHLMSR